MEVPDPESSCGFQVLPNPVRDIGYAIVDLEKPSFVTLKISDFLGKDLQTIMKRKYISGKEKIPFSTCALAPGPYYLILNLDNQQMLQKFLKQ
jgi:hypothetical protein